MTCKSWMTGSVVALLCAVASQGSLGQSLPGSDSALEAEHTSETAHQHHIAVFGGATVNLEKSGAHATIGLDYVFRLSEGRSPFGIGLYGEAILAGHTEWVVGMLAVYYPVDGLWFRTGPGVEFVTEDDEGEGRAEGTLSHSGEFLYRVGAGYTFGVGRFTVAPSLDLDIVRAHASLVAGVNFGYGF